MTISPLHEAALKYAAAGIPVFPCVPLSKKPATEHGQNDETNDIGQINAWWYENPNFNVAFRPDAAGYAVVDIDPGGERPWQELAAKHAGVANTYTIRTPRGGRHLYYEGALSPKVKIKGADGQKIDVDIRGGASYCLIPPSVTADGTYEVLHDIDVAPVPEWIAPHIASHLEHAPASDVDTDLPINLERARQRLTDLVAAGRVAVEGQGGDDFTYSLCAEILSMGVSPASALDLIEDIWNPHCEPPWSPEDLAGKMENASRYAQNEAGAFAVTPATETFAEAAKAYAPPAKASGFVSFSEVLARHVPPVRELVPGLIERGVVTFLSAPGGTHKSRLAVQIGLSLDTGTSIFGRAVERAIFVYISYEDHADEVARRSQAIARRLNLAGVFGRYCDLSGKDSPLAIVKEDGTYELMPFWHDLVAYLQSIPGHKFVVLDGTYNALRFAGQAKINETSVMLGIGLLQRLCDECDATVMPLWHPSQSGQERGDASGWSVAWHNAPRARLSLSAVKGSEDAFELKVEKRNHGAKGKPITLYWSDGALLPRTDIDTSAQNSLFLNACVDVAIAAAAQDTPIQRQRHLDGWMIAEIEAKSGRRPTNREAKEELARALSLGRLRYQKGYGRITAGYFPVETAVENG